MTAMASLSGDRSPPGGLGIWLFIFNDLVLFGLYFWAFMHDRSLEPEAFAQGRSALHGAFGLANTLVLLTSSCCVAIAVQQAPLNRRRASAWLQAGVLVGAIFLGLKAIEYNLLIDAGHSLLENRFFTWYFMLTGYHALHVLFGLLALSILALFVHQERLPANSPLVPGIANYWHMVDLIWLGLFSLLYLI